MANDKREWKFRKKPVVIEAFQWDGDLMDSSGKWYVPDWAIAAHSEKTLYFKGQGELYVKTLEGDHHATVGDYIIQGVKGEIYPCKPDIFAMTYEPAATAGGIPQSDGWVDVADRLPEAKEGWNHSEQCLVWYQPSLDAVGNYGIAYYHYDPPYRPCEWVDFAHLGRDPIAWQPLPAPYQRQSSEGE